MVTSRVIVIGLLCVNASKEFYKYLVRQENSFKINCFMVHAIVLTEVFLLIKHGRKDFYHASVSPLGCIFLGFLGAIFLFILLKVMISDIINWNKDFSNCIKQIDPYPLRKKLPMQFSTESRKHFAK